MNRLRVRRADGLPHPDRPYRQIMLTMGVWRPSHAPRRRDAAHRHRSQGSPADRAEPNDAGKGARRGVLVS